MPKLIYSDIFEDGYGVVRDENYPVPEGVKSEIISLKKYNELISLRAETLEMKWEEEEG